MHKYIKLDGIGRSQGTVFESKAALVCVKANTACRSRTIEFTYNTQLRKDNEKQRSIDAHVSYFLYVATGQKGTAMRGLG